MVAGKLPEMNMKPHEKMSGDPSGAFPALARDT